MVSLSEMTNNRMNLSRKKKLLLKTHTQFDGSSSEPPVLSYGDEGSHSQVVSVSVQQATPNSLIIQALIQQLCMHMESDGKKRKMLYTAICKILNQHKFLGLNIGLEELWPLKQQFCNVFSKFFRQVHEEISQSLGSCTTSLSISSVLDYVRTDYVHHSNRYQQNFEELETIAEGGFGIVFKARNKIDGITYAVKKIKFMYTNDLEFEKVMREVRSFALLKHQNIVNYNNSWLETNIVTGSRVYTTSSDSESYPSDSEQQISTNSFKTGNNETHDVSPLSNILSKTSATCGTHTNEKSSNLTSLLIDSLSEPVNVESHSFVIDSESYTVHQSIVIEENCSNRLMKTSEENIEQLSEMGITNFSPLCEFNCSSGKLSLPCQQVICTVMDETESSYSECRVVCHEVNESGDHSDKPSSRRRRHSSGPTCSTVDQNSEVDFNNKGISYQRTYNRVNSLDLKRCTELVPKKTDIKWDISNLDVMAVLYIQMELCDRSLRDLLDERANMNSNCKPDVIVKNALKIFQQIVQGVEHIHSKSIIHRDLKPKNIFLGNDNFIKIGDFGLAALCAQTDDTEIFHSSCSCSHTQGIGTVPYSAPEQRQPRKGYTYDNKVDIYSLGIIFIELLHNYQTRMEFFITVDKILEGSIPIEFVDVWPKEIVNLIRRLVSTNPQERPEAKEVFICLKRFQVAEPLTISSCYSCDKNREKKENEALEISKLKAQICALESQLFEKDEIIKELQLKLLYSYNCDSFV